MVTIGQSFYNSVLLMAYNFLAGSVTQEKLNNKTQLIDIKEAVIQNGYPFEEYQIQTQDGYLLTIHRIPHGRNNLNGSNQREIVYFQHGIVSSSYDWLILGPEYSLPYRLAEEGYDVWLGNSRGNRYSKKHSRFTSEESAYWRFSYHEIGYYDIPTTIDFILKTTQQKQLNYIGHSQGTTALLVTASERPEYIKYIRLFIACAPVVYSHNIRSLIAEVFATFYTQITWFINTYDYQELLPYDELNREVLRLACEHGMPYRNLCWLFVRTNFGYSEDTETDPTLFVHFLHSMPGGSGIRQMVHFIQNKVTDSFRQYDHGLMLNYVKYGRNYPPKYNLRTRLPTAIIYSDNDWVSTEEDIKRTSKQMKNIKSMHRTHFGHADYVLGKNSNKMLFDIIVNLLNTN